MQDEISELEEALDDLDRSYRRREAPDVNNGSFRHDDQQDRVALLREIRRKLEEYSLHTCSNTPSWKIKRIYLLRYHRQLRLATHPAQDARFSNSKGHQELEELVLQQ